MTERTSFRAYLHSWRTGDAKIDLALLLTALLAWSGSVIATLHGDSLPIILCLVLTQVYHAWNQLRTLDMPVRSWPSVMAGVVAELLAENPIRGRIMLGAALWAMQVLVMDLHDEIRTRGTSKVQQLLTTPDGIDTCSVLPM